MAEKLGVHYQTIGYLERGEFAPGLHLALKVANLFECPISNIFSLTPFHPGQRPQKRSESPPSNATCASVDFNSESSVRTGMLNVDSTNNPIL
ncbi:UNVERIFIED_CONTAM: hypothetical protein GTU68_046182 [Idotea baltica]|nr:hypothetical protein [Idotea baltica]